MDTAALRAADALAVLDPATYEDGPPLAALRRLRAAAPVVWVDEPPLHGLPGGPGCWLVLRHDDVERVLRDPATFDGSAGTSLARQAVALRPAPDAAGRLPDPRTREGMPDLYAYARLLADAKRRAPGADVMSLLLAQVDEDGGSVSDAEFESMFWLFAVAGNETLRNGLPGGLIALLTHPDALARLRADPGLLPGAVEEMLRWWTPVMVFRRTARVDVELGGVRVRAGDKVVVSFTSANRDERVFADPDRFDVLRTPNPHLSFGHGPHFCLGAQLARVQVRALFGALLRRTSSVELDGRPALLRSSFQRGVKRLPLRWIAA